jgi:hypothetical protein
MKFLTTLIASAILFPSLALADPGTGSLTNFEGKVKGSVNVNSPDLLYAVVPGTVNSKLFKVDVATAYLWFFPDTSASGGTARISVYRAIDASDCDAQNATTVIGQSAILYPAVPFDFSNGVELKRGCHWIEIDTAASSGDTGMVSISAQVNK